MLSNPLLHLFQTSTRGQDYSVGRNRSLLDLLVGIAFLLGAPLAWWAMSQWLQGFAYRTSIQWWIFPLTGLVVVLIAFLTISYQSIRVTKANPVMALKTD